MLAPLHILVTAGPTREAIDPVRYIGNRSSGKMGYAVAAVAADHGHATRLISGPVTLTAPAGVPVTAVVSAAEMLHAVTSQLAWCDVLVMCAAVADWRPRAPQAHKIKKSDRILTLELEPTVDVLQAIAPLKGTRLFVGFAAETSDVINHAAAKLHAKQLDYIVANDVSGGDAGFEVDVNRAVLLGADGCRETWPLMSKHAMAERLLEIIEARCG